LPEEEKGWKLSKSAEQAHPPSTGRASNIAHGRSPCKRHIRRAASDDFSSDGVFACEAVAHATTHREKRDPEMRREDRISPRKAHVHVTLPFFFLQRLWAVSRREVEGAKWRRRIKKCFVAASTPQKCISARRFFFFFVLLYIFCPPTAPSRKHMHMHIHHTDVPITAAHQQLSRTHDVAVDLPTVADLPASSYQASPEGMTFCPNDRCKD
jgi:hypothetical protein